jgi:hypothetical protein
MLLEKGRVVQIGEVGRVVEEYIPKPVDAKSYAKFDNSTHPVVLDEAAVEDEDGTPRDRFDIAEDIWIRVRYTVKQPQQGLLLALRLHTSLEVLFKSHDTDEHATLGLHPAGVFEKRLKIRGMFLKEGDYFVTIEQGTVEDLFDRHERALKFSVEAKSIDTQHKGYRRDRPGPVICQGRWFDSVPSGGLLTAGNAEPVAFASGQPEPLESHG